MPDTRKSSREQCYTPYGVALSLTSYLINEVGADTGSVWIEPAAGTGSFLRAARELGVSDILAYDIDPRGEGIVLADFLDESLPPDGSVCITNPPFGRYNSLSVPFFNKLAKTCDVIGFVVPRSWRKWDVVDRLDRRFVKIADFDLSVAYENEHEEPTVGANVLETVFQVWARCDSTRPERMLPHQEGALRETTPAEASVAVVRYGAGCGRVMTAFDRAPDDRLLFLSAQNDVVEELKRLDLSPFTSNVSYLENAPPNSPIGRRATIPKGSREVTACYLTLDEVEYALAAHRSGLLLPADLLVQHGLTTHRRYPIPTGRRTGRFSS